MAEYDAEFAGQRKRRDIRGSQELSCGICKSSHLDTASDYEWPCLILEDWICETHCAEIQLPWSEYGQAYIFAMLKVAPQSKEAKAAYAEWMAICGRCPYGPR